MKEDIHKHPFHTYDIEDTLEKLETSEKGLDETEAKRRKKTFGANRIERQKEKSLFQIFISQVNNPVVYLLLAAAMVSLVFKDYPEAIAITVVIILNTIIGFWMEYQAKTSMDALKKIDKLKAIVHREGESTEINAEDLVPGDIIELKAGNVIPADARLIFTAEFSVDESPLTGESVPIEKNTVKTGEGKQLHDRICMAYKGTAVVNGKARAVVTATASKTEIGKISKMVSEADEESTPLNRKLEAFSKKLIWVTLGLAALFFVFGYFTGKEIYRLLQTAIAWTVAAIPEGLPIVASIALARGMLRLAKKNVIVKKLAAVETLGETTTVFTDKTGTLTENKLTVEKLALPKGNVEVNWKNKLPNLQFKSDASKNENFDHIYKIGVFCNNAEIPKDKNPKGDPLEIALLQYASKYNKKEYHRLQELERINEDPFDSESKMMGTIHKLKDSLYISAKGAIKPILENSTHILLDGKKKKMSNGLKKEWEEKDNSLSAEGLRVIGFAFKKVDIDKEKELKEKEEFIEEMVFVGAIGFIDPPRYDIKESMNKCHEAGIKIVMVTGDHPETSVNIAKQINLIEDDDGSYVHGKEIDEIAKGQKKGGQKITDTKVFARVDPSQKLEIVSSFKDKGEITGMTGDGINDAPALKKANIGIAMGKRGSQVAQDVADMVLKDDAFSSIVKAIEQGRIIFGNIRKFIMYQLSYHLAEIMIIAGISFTMLYLPLLPLQLLFLNLLSDVFPALALGLSKGNDQIMQEKPKDPKEPIITRKNWIAIFVYGLVITVFVIAAYLYGYYSMNLSKEFCNDIAFFSLAISQLLHVFNMREAKEHIIKNQVTQNKYIWMALSFCVLALIAGYNIPVLSNILGFEQLNANIWALIGITSFSTLTTIQIIKRIFKI